MSEENKEEFETPSEKEIDSAPLEDFASSENTPSEEALRVRGKAPLVFSFRSFLTSAIALVLATLMVTYTCCSIYFRGKIAEAKKGVAVTGGSDYYELDVLRYLFEQYSFEELNDREIITRVMKAYVEATGDRYAAYFTREEYAKLMEGYAGNTVGIGITITETTISVNGTEQSAIEIIRVNPRSPAYEAGIRTGDYIVAVGTGEAAESVTALTYDVAYNRLLGEEGSKAEFVVFRSDGSAYQPIEFSVERKKIKTESVIFGKYVQDPSVGIIRILSFDLTTPTQFCEAVDTLQQSGCNRFIFDVRDNPGGLLSSIQAVLSYFLNDGDVILSEKDKSGNKVITKAKEISENDADYAGFTVTKKDLGKYRNLNTVIVCNGNTASAGELFVAAFRDYKLATIVGTNTFGKGSMQEHVGLEQYGVSGVLKLTKKYYFPPCGEGYDGLGIAPGVTVDLSEEERKNFNIYEFESDSQLREAVKHFR